MQQSRVKSLLKELPSGQIGPHAKKFKKKSINNNKRIIKIVIMTIMIIIVIMILSRAYPNPCSGQPALTLIGWFERAVILCGGTKAQK